MRKLVLLAACTLLCAFNIKNDSKNLVDIFNNLNKEKCYGVAKMENYLVALQTYTKANDKKFEFNSKKEQTEIQLTSFGYSITSTNPSLFDQIKQDGKLYTADSQEKYIYNHDMYLVKSFDNKGKKYYSITTDCNQ